MNSQVQIKKAALCTHPLVKPVYYNGEPLQELECQLCGEELECNHENVTVEDDSFDYAGTHCNNGQAGTQVVYSAVCDDCEANISDTYDWDSHFDRGDESDYYDDER